MGKLSEAQTEITRKSLFFGALPETVYSAIIKQAKVVNRDAGATLFRQGEQAEAVFLVLDGLIKLSVWSSDGDETVVDIMHAGNSFAEALIFQNAGYPVTATALLESHLLMVPNTTIRSEFNANPEAFGAVITSTFIHLRKLVRQVEQLKSTSGHERVARYLLTLSQSQADPSDMKLPYDKQTLASLLGIKPETLSRAFNRLKDHGVHVDGPRIRIKNRSALRQFLSRD